MKTVTVASLIYLVIVSSFCIFILYCRCFKTMQESFVQIGGATDAPFYIADETDFLAYADTIQVEASGNFPGVVIDNDVNTSAYYKRTDNQNLHEYNVNNKYTWDAVTVQLYKQFLNGKNISVSDVDFTAYVEKLRTVYNQPMILELMSRETERYKFVKTGAVVDDGNNEILEPWNSSMTLLGSQYIVKCGTNNNLTMYNSVTDYDNNTNGTSLGQRPLQGLSYPDGTPCNPCDTLLDPDDPNKNKCRFDLNMRNSVGISGNGIWNKIWELLQI